MQPVRLSTWMALVFVVAISAHRMAEGFKRRGTTAGDKQMSWSFYVFFVLHVLINIGSFVECAGWRTALDWTWTATGLLLYGLAVVIRGTAIRALGRFWSLHVEIRQEHQLIREGIYDWVRHPIYAAIVLEVVSVPLVMNAWLTMALAVVFYLPLLGWRLVFEERAMVAKFGEQYRQYQREVGALIPHWSRLFR